MKENKSKCCGSQVRLNEAVCDTCLNPCEVEAVIDSPGGVPEEILEKIGYQEDIKAGVEVGEPDELQEKEHELMNKIYSSGRESMKSEILSKIKGLGCEKGFDRYTIANILNILR